MLKKIVIRNGNKTCKKAREEKKGKYKDGEVNYR